MKLLRFGKTVVNMERVNSIEITGTVAHLYWSAPITTNGIDTLLPDFTKLEGRDVEALERWLKDNCEVINSRGL